MSEQVERGMMVFKVKTDKESIKTLVYQTCMLTTQCTKDNIKIIDCVITFGGGKSVIAEIKRVKARKDFQSVLLFSPKAVASSSIEYRTFLAAMNDMGLEVRLLKETE